MAERKEEFGQSSIIKIELENSADPDVPCDVALYQDIQKLPADIREDLVKDPNIFSETFTEEEAPPLEPWRKERIWQGIVERINKLPPDPPKLHNN